jgi:thiosulfate/3-mercaptopyruvate sulfurtransferase
LRANPLPDRTGFALKLGAWGIDRATPVVCYDAQGGCYAARAWWLLRWMGHDDLAVLDGGVAAWQATGGALDSAAPLGAPLPPYPTLAPALPTLDAAALRAGLGRARLVDARAAERFRGDVEPLDRVAGHIPGARNRFFKSNLAADGRFKPAAELRAEWAALALSGEPTVHYCGSGVTACHNLLAQAHAGLGDGVLYPGSWSEWSDDTARPIARG